MLNTKMRRMFVCLAAVCLSVLFFTGCGGEQWEPEEDNYIPPVSNPPQLSVDELLQTAEQGDPKSQCALGECYVKGDGVQQDYDKAFKWFRKAADQGFAEAQDWIGGCYMLGLGVEETPDEMVGWHHRLNGHEFE